MSAQPTTYEVFTGAWTDWSRGRVLGATLTLSRQDGTLLIAFLAFFVALVGTRFWRLSCLILHYAYSKDRPSDGVHNQRQVFLRNAPNPEAALWKLANMGLSWRRNAEQVWTRLLPPFILAVVCVIGFTLASGFSPNIATLGGSEVLISGGNCARLMNDENPDTYGDTVGTLMAETFIASENYARQCYATTATGVSCDTYVRRNLLPALVDTNADCPFDPKLCKNPSGNLFLDTGLLDSHRDFGLNTPENRRIQFRRTFHCAPLATDGYRSTNQTHTTYYYGSMLDRDEEKTKNYTSQFLNNNYPDIEELTRYSGDTAHDFSVR